MKASAPRIEDAHTIERRDAEFVFPLNRLARGSNRNCEARTRRWPLVSTNIVENVLGGSEAGRAFQNPDETRFTRTVLSEDDCHAWSEIDLCAGLERVDAVPNLQRIQADRVERVPGELLFLNFRNGLERLWRELFLR